MTIVKPLYGHTSPETAYVVNDYPYGFRLRTSIRYWIEYKPSKGFRLVTQTRDPKKAGEVWNKPKAGNYHAFAAALYLDENGHVQCSGIGTYSKDTEISNFINNFPDAPFPDLKLMILTKIRYCKGKLDGSVVFTVNGIPRSWTETDLEEARKDLAFWEELKAKYC